MVRGTSHQEIKATDTLQKIKSQNMDYSGYSKGFVKENTVRKLPLVLFSGMLTSLIVMLAIASENYSILVCLLLIPLFIFLVYWQARAKRRKQEQFMKEHFMKQGDPRYWGRAGNERNDGSSS